MTDIQEVRAIANPQRSYQWEVSLVGLSTGSDADLTFHAKTVSIPNSQVESIVINYKAAHSYYAGRDSSSHAVSITFWDDESGTVRSYFQRWFDELMFNPITGSQTPKNLYTADVILTLMDSSGASSTGQIVLSSAFPTEVADIGLTYDSSEPIEVTVSFMYDTKALIALPL